MVVKVCHMTSTHLPKDQRIFYKECVSLTNAGYDVYLVEQGESVEDSGVHIVGTGEQKKSVYYRLLVRPLHVYRLAKKLKADVYHFHDMELLPYGVLLKNKKNKVIFDYHEDFASKFAESQHLPGPAWFKNFIAKLYLQFEIWALKKVDAVISVTPHICERLKKVNPHVYMITNYPVIPSEADMLVEEYNAVSEYVAFAGQVSEVYSISTIIDALQEFKEIQFKMCGVLKRDGDLAEYKSRDKNNIVNYIGMLPYMGVFAFFSGARAAFALPNYTANTCGKLGTLGCNKLYEAMASGVPVICTDYTLWTELIQKYQCGICVNPNSRSQIQKAVRYILDHPEEAAEMGRKGREAVLTEFNWNTQEKILLSVYQDLAVEK